jgi:hypothetical protein
MASNNKPGKPSTLTPERLMQLSWGYAPPLIIEAAVKHQLFDFLDAGPCTAAQLAKKAGASLRGVNAICNALAGLGFLTKKGVRYQLTGESAAFLVSRKPGYHGAFFAHISGQLMPQWLALNQIVHTGKPAQRVNSEHRQRLCPAMHVPSQYSWAWHKRAHDRFLPPLLLGEKAGMRAGKHSPPTAPNGNAAHRFRNGRHCLKFRNDYSTTRLPCLRCWYCSPIHL